MSGSVFDENTEQDQTELDTEPVSSVSGSVFSSNTEPDLSNETRSPRVNLRPHFT